MRDSSQEVAHKMDLTPLPTGSYPFFSKGILDPQMSVRDTETYFPHPATLEFVEKLTPGGLRLIIHRFYGQDLSLPLTVYSISKHQSHRYDSAIVPDLFIKSIDPKEWILSFQLPAAELFYLLREPLIDL
jgi:hypothetical protein